VPLTCLRIFLLLEIDCHFIDEKISSGDITNQFANFNYKLADIFIKSLWGPMIYYICNKHGDIILLYGPRPISMQWYI